MKFKSALISLSLAFSFLTKPSWADQNERRVMILPFKNLTRAEADNWLGDSFSESLLMGLGQVRSIKLLERSELAQIIKEQAFMQSLLADPDKAPEIGKLIGADQMILGSYQKIGNRIQVNVRIVNVLTGEIDNSTLTQIQGPFEELFELQEDLAEQLIQKLKVESNPTELKQMQARIKATKSTRAQEYYQKAKAIAENLFLSDQQLKDSIQNFRLAIQEDSQYAQAYVGLSERLSLRGRSKHSLYSQEPEDLSQALQYADTAIELLPELDSAYRAKAKALQALKRNQEALQFALKSVELSKSTSNIIWYLELKYPAYKTQDSFTIIEAELKKLQADFDDPQITNLLVFEYIKKFMSNPSSDLRPAVQLLDNALEKHPNNPSVLMMLATVSMLNQDVKQAEVYVQKIVSIDPNNAILLFSSSLLLRYANKEKAIELAKQSLKVQADLYFSHLLLMEIYQLTDKNKPKAMEHYQLALETAPQEPYVDYMAGMIFYRAKSYTEAIEYLEKSLNKSRLGSVQGNAQGITSTLKLLGQAYLALKQDKLARQKFEEALRFPGDSEISLAYTYYHLAMLDLDQKNYQQALERFTQFIQLAPAYADEDNNPVIYRLLYLLVQEQQGTFSAAAYNDIGQGFYLLERYEHAFLYFQKGIQLDSQNPTLHFNFGLLYLAQNNQAAAQSEFERALEIKPDYIKALFSLGQLAQEQGHKQLAKEYFARILKIDPQHDRAQEALEKL